MATIQLGMGFGTVPDCTADILLGKKTNEHGFLDPNAQGQYVSCAYNHHHGLVPRGATVVYGSLGFGYRKSPYWVAGGKDSHVMKDFGKRWHTWLEHDGKVYDVVTPEWHELAARNMQLLLLGSPDEPYVIQGAAYKALEEVGLHYLPAPQETQGIMDEVSRKAYDPVLKKLGVPFLGTEQRGGENEPLDGAL